MRGIYHYWPYSNVHELNLNWIIEQFREFEDKFGDNAEKAITEYISNHLSQFILTANYNEEEECIYILSEEVD